jgi:hypothetical protein
MALRWPAQPIRPVQAGIEPLWRIRRHHLPGQHGRNLIMKALRVTLGVKIPAFEAPIGPHPRKAQEHLAGAGLVAVALFFGHRLQRCCVRHRTP